MICGFPLEDLVKFRPWKWPQINPVMKVVMEITRDTITVDDSAAASTSEDLDFSTFKFPTCTY